MRLPGRILDRDRREDDPLALFQLCNSGRRACKRSDEENLAKIERMIELNPACVCATDAYGKTPLHAACANPVLKSNLPVIKLLVTTSDFMIEEERNLPQRRNFRIRRGKRFSFTQKTGRVISQKCSRGSLPLHVAMKEGASFEVIEYLVLSHPGSVLLPDSTCGNLPLHNACMKVDSMKLPIEAFVFLIQQWQDSVRQQNMDGDLPLHLAVQSISKISAKGKSNRYAKQSGKSGGSDTSTQETEQSALDLSYSSNVGGSSGDTEHGSNVVVEIGPHLDDEDEGEESSGCSLNSHEIEMEKAGNKDEKSEGKMKEEELRRRQHLLEVVQLLVEYWPESTKVENKDGYTPYEIAVSLAAASSDPVVAFLSKTSHTVEAASETVNAQAAAKSAEEDGTVFRTPPMALFENPIFNLANREHDKSEVLDYLRKAKERSEGDEAEEPCDGLNSPSELTSRTMEGVVTACELKNIDDSSKDVANFLQNGPAEECSEAFDSLVVECEGKSVCQYCDWSCPKCIGIVQ